MNSKLPIIIAVDINARSTLWHNGSTDDRGRAVETFIILNDLVVANCESVLTTYENTSGHCSSIDVTLYSHVTMMSITTWQISPHSLLTDHRMITFMVKDHSGGRLRHGQDSPMGEVTESYNMRNREWGLFDVILRTDLEELVNFYEKNLEDIVESMSVVLKRAQVESTPSQGRRKVAPK